MENIEELKEKVDTKNLLDKDLYEWRNILANECQVFVCGENYLAKKFDQINYRFCALDEAKEILIDNLYALLRYKYFTVPSVETDKYIFEVVKNFTLNLKSTLKKVSFDNDSNAIQVYSLPSYCCAFKNGVYDFKNNEWLFKYEKVSISALNNVIYLYPVECPVLWYININFDPLPFALSDVSLSELLEVLKEVPNNYCAQLMYNIAHDQENKFDLERFTHLCEIIGFTLLRDFSQYFVMLIGSGGNGKNSLLDGCFTSFVNPRPVNNDLNEIENDKFITGALENRYHNIYLESDAKVYTKSTNLKNLTGSMYQTIQPKGVNKYPGIINCKFIFSGNDQDKIKFEDTTDGFRRRINLYEIYYKWDSEKSFLKKGDYYDTTFSEDLRELKKDDINVISYIYFGMKGIEIATGDFDHSFKFTKNDWKQKYAEIDVETKEALENITIDKIVSYIRECSKEDLKTLFFDTKNRRLYQSPLYKSNGFEGMEDLEAFLTNDESRISYFSNDDIFVSLKMLQKLSGILKSSTAFTQSIKKIYNLQDWEFNYGNKPYLRCSFEGNKLVVVRR